MVVVFGKTFNSALLALVEFKCLQKANCSVLVSRLKMAQLHSQSIVPCIRELQRIVGCADDSAMDAK